MECVCDVDAVAPLVGAWVETQLCEEPPGCATSRPSWARGLKLLDLLSLRCTNVAPLVGAWVETSMPESHRTLLAVAPLVGAWVETDSVTKPSDPVSSRPSWARGLKRSAGGGTHDDVVAPLVGAWVETST